MARQYGGTSEITTLFAPMTAPSPMVTPFMMWLPLPIQAWRQVLTVREIEDAGIGREFENVTETGPAFITDAGGLRGRHLVNSRLPAALARQPTDLPHPCR
jgi:hypothetical protein